MKKYLFLLLPLIMLSCSSDDDNTGSVYIDRFATGYNETSKNDNGKYDNRFNATVINTTNQPVTGHVRFEIKEYGYIYSESGEVTNQPGYEKTFGASLETEKIIDESYLIGAEFVRD